MKRLTSIIKKVFIGLVFFMMPCAFFAENGFASHFLPSQIAANNAIVGNGCCDLT